MKNLLTFLLLMAMMFSLSGCGINIDFEDEKEEVTGEEVLDGEGMIKEVDDDGIASDVEEDESDEDEDEADEDEEADEEDLEEDDEPEFEKELIERGDAELSDIDVLKKYYQHIEDGELEDAFDMRVTSKTTYSTFEGWYKNVNDTFAYDFEEVVPHKYQFTVELDEVGGVEETFFVVTEVKDDEMLKNISSVKTWDNYSPKVSKKTVSGKTNIYVTTDGVEKWVGEVNDSGDGDVVRREQLMDYYITPNEKYLVYETLGWEWRQLFVFDINSGKTVLATGGQVDDYGFSNDYENFYFCGGTGMHGGQVNIYPVDNFNSPKSLVTQAFIWSCDGYNSSSNTYNYKILIGPNYSYDNPVSRMYHFDTGIID
ncbi:hypothetical protein HN709_04170 [Candidatus Peregrinibacteria bacterium]|jgi:hypothetical protein|nr:hypothetical protein [Candidatus Peregrinibacteria bacterium]MBT7736859.1 hypothetical protein [Candidatus Peregrinibacteria bacterium]